MEQRNSKTLELAQSDDRLPLLSLAFEDMTTGNGLVDLAGHDKFWPFG